MNKKELIQLTRTLISEAKEQSKYKILQFVKQEYGVDEDAFEHLWEVPIVATYEDDVIFPIELEGADPDEILDVIDSVVKSELGSSKSAFIRIDNIVSELPVDLMEQYDKGLVEGDINEEYNAVIVYDEQKLIGLLESLLKSRKIDEEKAKEVFLETVSQIFTHERIHLNTECMQLDANDDEEIQILNGAENKEGIGTRKEESDRNEVLIDTVAQIIHKYDKDRSIEDCLEEIIKERGSETQYDSMDDTEGLAIITLFPEQLVDWTMFEGYEQSRYNMFEAKRKVIFGDFADEKLSRNEMLKRVGDCYNNVVAKDLSTDSKKKRKVMLETLGVKNILPQVIENSELFESATSREAIDNIATGKNILDKIKNDRIKE